MAATAVNAVLAVKEALWWDGKGSALRPPPTVAGPAVGSAMVTFFVQSRNRNQLTMWAGHFWERKLLGPIPCTETGRQLQGTWPRLIEEDLIKTAMVGLVRIIHR